MTKKQKQVMSLFIILTLFLTVLVFLYKAIGRPYEIRKFEVIILSTVSTSYHHIHIYFFKKIKKKNNIF